MYFKKGEYNMDVLSVHLLFSAIEDKLRHLELEFNSELTLENVVSCIAKSINVAEEYNLELGDYVELVLRSNIATKFYLSSSYNNTSSYGEISGNFLHTLIMRVCNEFDGETTKQITDNFINQFNKIIDRYKEIKKTKFGDIKSYCDEIAGIRWGGILNIIILCLIDENQYAFCKDKAMNKFVACR